MKKIILLLIILLLVVFFFPKKYISSPGFTTREYAEEFEKTKKHCFGFDRLTNEDAMAADAPGESICMGWLY